jgi:plasmid stability protein
MQTAQLTIRVPKPLHQALKMASARESRSIQDIAIEALSTHIAQRSETGPAAFFQFRDQLLANAKPGEFDLAREDFAPSERVLFDDQP